MCYINSINVDYLVSIKKKHVNFYVSSKYTLQQPVKWSSRQNVKWKTTVLYYSCLNEWNDFVRQLGWQNVQIFFVLPFS